jgi:hypothetical protein
MCSMLHACGLIDPWRTSNPWKLSQSYSVGIVLRTFPYGSIELEARAGLEPPDVAMFELNSSQMVLHACQEQAITPGYRFCELVREEQPDVGSSKKQKSPFSDMEAGIILGYPYFVKMLPRAPAPVFKPVGLNWVKRTSYAWFLAF